MSDFLYSDLKLAIPIILFPCGELSDSGKLFVQAISQEITSIDSSDKAFLEGCSERNIVAPVVTNVQVCLVHSISNLNLIKKRIQQDNKILFLKYITYLFFIDYSLNPDIESVKNLVTSLFHPDFLFHVCYFVYKGSESLLSKHSDDMHISFDSYSDDVAKENMKLFLTQRVLTILTTRIRNQIRPNTKNSLNYLLSTISSDKKEQFESIVRIAKKSKSDNATALELIGIFEHEYPGELRDAKFFEKAQYEKLWKENSQNDLINLLSSASASYVKANLITKALDCTLRAINYTYDFDLVNEAVKLVKQGANSSIYYHCCELISLLIRMNYVRKVPLYIYLISQYFSVELKIEFLIKTIEFISKQESGPIIIRELCFPIIKDNIFPSALDTPSMLEKCILYLKILSLAGNTLSQKDQSVIFNILKNLRIGDIKIPCEFGFKIQNEKFLKQKLVYEMNANSQTVSSTPFKYSYISAKADPRMITTTIGKPVQIEMEIYNPFVNLAVIVNAMPSEDYECSIIQCCLKTKQFSKARYTIIPIKEGKIKISSLIISIKNGFEIVNLTKEMTINVIGNSADFSFRSNLPLYQKLNLYDGEQFNLLFWLNNNGSNSIDKLDVRIGNDNIGNIALPLQPYSTLEVCHSLLVTNILQQITIDISAFQSNSDNSEIKATQNIVQPIQILPALYISSINLLDTTPEIDIDFSNLVFIAVDIVNASSSIFNYSAKFEAAAEIGFDFPGIISKKETNGILAENETTTFILAVQKDKILFDTISVSDKRFVDARKNEEERINHKLTAQERENINDRVKIASFIESNLIFKWRCNVSRNGVLVFSNVLPSQEVLDEIRIKRPKIFHSFDANPITTNKMVRLNVKFENSYVEKCKLVLDKYQDEEYGIVWEESLEKVHSNPDSPNEFVFTLYFCKPIHFDFRIAYRTSENIQGSTRIDVNVVE